MEHIKRMIRGLGILLLLISPFIVIYNFHEIAAYVGFCFLILVLLFISYFIGIMTETVE